MSKKLNPIEKYAGGVLAGFMRSKLDAMALQPAIFSDLYGKKIEEQQRKDAAQVLQQAYRANLARKVVAEKMMPNLNKQAAKLQAAIKRKKATKEYTEFKPQVQQTALFIGPEEDETRELLKKNSLAAFDKQIAYTVQDIRGYSNNYAKLTELRNQYLPKGELTEDDLEYTASPKQKLIYRLWLKENDKQQKIKQAARRERKAEERAAQAAEEERQRRRQMKEEQREAERQAEKQALRRARKEEEKEEQRQAEKQAEKEARKLAEKEAERQARKQAERQGERQFPPAVIALPYPTIKTSKSSSSTPSTATRIKAEYTNEELDNMSERDFNALYMIAFPPGQGVPVNETRGHQDIYNARRRRERKAKR
jgi:hypothetical protein